MGGKRVKYPETDSPPNKWGSITHWSKRDGEDVPVTCGECGCRRTVKSSDVNGRGFTGLCAKCYLQLRTLSGDHPIGKVGSIYHPKSSTLKTRVSGG